MIVTRKMLVLTFVLCCLFLAGVATKVSAQQEEGYGQGQQQEGYGQDMMQQSPGDLEVSDAELDRVASAYIEISRIREDFQESLAEVTDPEEAQLMQEQAGEAMVEAVQDNGLDVQKYNQVMEAAQVDEQLREKLLTRLEQMQ
jgi:hypothetical protein